MSETRIKATITFRTKARDLREFLAEHQESHLAPALSEVLDKAIACDSITVQISEGPENEGDLQ